MPSVKFSPGALCDMERLHDFLQIKNPIVSRKVAKTIVQSLKIIEKHPQIGRPADDMDPGYRELVMSFGQSGSSFYLFQLYQGWRSSFYLFLQNPGQRQVFFAAWPGLRLPLRL